MSISQCKSIYNFVNRVREDLQNEAENSLVDVRGETTAGKIVASIFFSKSPVSVLRQHQTDQKPTVPWSDDIIIASISIATIPN